jgi:hypothetical protein
VNIDLVGGCGMGGAVIDEVPYRQPETSGCRQKAGTVGIASAKSPWIKKAAGKRAEEH